MSQCVSYFKVSVKGQIFKNVNVQMYFRNQRIILKLKVVRLKISVLAVLLNAFECEAAGHSQFALVVTGM